MATTTNFNQVIIDDGLQLTDGVPSTTTNKLYNDGGTLTFNGSAVGGGSSYTAGSGLTLVGTEFNTAGTGNFTQLTFDDNKIQIGENSFVSTSGIAIGQNAQVSGYEIEVYVPLYSIDFVERGHDSIAMYSVNGGTGRLSLLGIVPTGGENPRNFGIDPTNRFVLVGNQSSDTVTYHRLDPDTGHLHLSGVVANIPMAVCLKMTLVV